MGFWTKVEKWSEKHVEGFFKNKFTGAVQPAEMAKMIVREMRDRKTVSVSKIYIPNEYTVYVGDKDWDRISSIAGSLSRELQDFLVKKADQRKYAMVGPAVVKFENKEGISQGLIEVAGRFTELLPEEAARKQKTAEPLKVPEINKSALKVGEVSNETIVVQREDVLASLGSGPKGSINQSTLASRHSTIIAVVTVKTAAGSREYPIGLKPVIIGRRRSSGIPLLDENVSRVHAEITYADGVHFVEDRGSTNGVFVNGQRILKKKLMDGDTIKLGGSILEYKVV